MKKIVSKGNKMIKILNSRIKKIETVNLDIHKLPVVISIPHSGTYISKTMKDNLLDNVIFSNIDWYLPQFYSFLNELGFTTIINNVSRYEIDPNRNINETNKGKSYAKSLIYSKTTFGNEMYKNEPDCKEIEYRINEFYAPYHQLINNALKEKIKYFEKVYLIDLHSFGKDVSADIVLGNDNKKTTSDSFLEFTINLLNKEGFKVKNNMPYSGGYITRYYGNKFKNCEAMQIELSYNAYIDKKEFREEAFPNINLGVFSDAQHKMRSFFEELRNKLIENKCI